SEIRPSRARSVWIGGSGRDCSDCGSGRESAGLPIPGQQLVDPVDRMVGQPCEHLGEPGARVDVIELAGGNQRIDRGGARHLTLRAEQGDSFLVPEWMTQSDAATVKVVEAPCISVAQLRALRAF